MTATLGAPASLGVGERLTTGRITQVGWPLSPCARRGMICGPNGSGPESDHRQRRAGDGNHQPQQGRGDSRPWSGGFPDTPDQTRDAVRSALGAGYRHIDTAAAYGNERQSARRSTASDVDRSEVFLETKVWISDYGYDETLHAFEKSARKLGVDQIDLLILHQALPSAFERTLEAYRALETLLDGGKAERSESATSWSNTSRRSWNARRWCRRSTRSRSTPTSRSDRCRTSAPSMASSRKLGNRLAASPSTATVVAAARSRIRSSETLPGPTARRRPK